MAALLGVQMVGEELPGGERALEISVRKRWGLERLIYFDSYVP